MIADHVVSALGIVVLDRFARGGPGAGPGRRRPARGRRSAGAHEEPASAPERHASTAGRRDHARLQRGSGRRVRSLPHLDEARRSEQRHGGRHEDREDGGARHDADDERDQHEARRQHQETGRPDRARRVRDLSSRRGDSRDAAATASAGAGRSAGRARGTTGQIAACLTAKTLRRREPDLVKKTLRFCVSAVEHLHYPMIATMLKTCEPRSRSPVTDTCDVAASR